MRTPKTKFQTLGRNGSFLRNTSERYGEESGPEKALCTSCSYEWKFSQCARTVDSCVWFGVGVGDQAGVLLLAC